jgi:hypothetical protein
MVVGGAISSRGRLASVIPIIVGLVLVFPYAVYNGIKTTMELPAFLKKLQQEARGGYYPVHHLHCMRVIMRESSVNGHCLKAVI